MNDILEHRKEVIANIEKAFDTDIQKARSGRYTDTPENRKLGRVGMEYGEKKGGKEMKESDMKLSIAEKREIISDFKQARKEANKTEPYAPMRTEAGKKFLANVVKKYGAEKIAYLFLKKSWASMSEGMSSIYNQVSRSAREMMSEEKRSEFEKMMKINR